MHASKRQMYLIRFALAWSLIIAQLSHVLARRIEFLHQRKGSHLSTTYQTVDLVIVSLPTRFRILITLLLHIIS